MNSKPSLTRDVLGLHYVVVEVNLDDILNEEVSKVIPVKLFSVVIFSDLCEQIDQSTDKEDLLFFLMLDN